MNTKLFLLAKAAISGLSVTLLSVTLWVPHTQAAPLRLAHNGEVHPDKVHSDKAAAKSGDNKNVDGKNAPSAKQKAPIHQAAPHQTPASSTTYGHQMPQSSQPTSRTLPPLPDKLPAWMNNKEQNHLFYKRGVYNDDVYNIRPLALDLNAVAVGHAFAYEDLVTGRAATLETQTFERIKRVLKSPPKFMPDEANISPTFGRRYGVLEQMFDWTHILHAQTVDVLASTQMTPAQKDKEIKALWDFYFTSVPYAITPLPMNMEWLDSQPYSMAFRRKYPKVNGLFWGYHWLQGAMYDGLDGIRLEQQRTSYEVMGKRYHDIELYRTDRPFMPMFAEVSPKFGAKYPHIANAFDNLHMLHDMVNDILASDWISEKQKAEQIARAMWIVSHDAHRNEQPGDKGEGLHDHRFMEGMPGMGMMKGSTTEVMYMPKMGWMRMDECHHCSMPLPTGENAWRASTVSAEGWTMRTRCALCARDMGAESKGEAILRIPLESTDKTLVVLSSADGTLRTVTPNVLFLEEPGSHAKCHEWSRAFSNRAAFDVWVKANPKYKAAKALTWPEWANVETADTPDTYEKPKGPVENPYEETGKPETQTQKAPEKKADVKKAVQE